MQRQDQGEAEMQRQDQGRKLKMPGRTRERQRCRGRTRERQARSVTPRLPTQGGPQVSPEQPPVPRAPPDDTPLLAAHLLSNFTFCSSLFTHCSEINTGTHYMLLVNSLPERRQAQGSLRQERRGGEGRPFA